MDDATLEAFVRDYIASQNTPEVTFAWQGGEPTLLGVEFFARVVELQARYAGGKRVSNTFQTNGTLLDDAWGEFLHQHRFLVGLSVDGPPELHDIHRLDRRGGPTSHDVMRGLAVLQKHQVEFNLLTVVNSRNVRHPQVVYRYLRKTGAKHFQFIPIVERAVAAADDLGTVPTCDTVSDESVPAEAYGDFLCTIFDEWIKRDVGKIFVRDFDVMLGLWSGLPSSLCVYAETCGRALAVEHDGSVYSCDHYVYASHRLGNLHETPLAAMVESPFQRRFATDKHDAVPPECHACPWWFACHGGCPKHRLASTPAGHDQLNHLCPGLKKFFAHIDRPMRQMAELLRQEKPPAAIMRR